jgi:hypothetical protein
VMRSLVCPTLTVNVCLPLQRLVQPDSAAPISLTPKHQPQAPQVCGQNEEGTTSIQLDGGNEAGHKSAQTGMRSSLPLQVSRCQGEFIYIIH